MRNISNIFIKVMRKKCNYIGTNRLDSLDYLRGMMALSVMIHYLTLWNLYHPIILVSILTIIVSLISWNFFEKKLIIYGKNISKRLLTNGGFNFKWN